MIVNISICTCQRPRLLAIAIDSLLKMAYPENTQVIISIVDNDPEKSAEPVVNRYLNLVDFLHYVSEPRRGIPVARNAAVAFAVSLNADYLVFIDDDEWVEKSWLIELFNYCQIKGGRSVISGHVIADLPDNIPAHLAKLFNKKESVTGRTLKSCATNNVIIPMYLFSELGLTFDESHPFAGGEDILFFSEAVVKGVIIFKCSESVVHEHIPKSRISLKWLGQRKFQAGITVAIQKISKGHPNYTVLMYAFFQVLFSGVGALLFLLLNIKQRRNNYYLKACRSFGVASGAMGIRVNSYENIDNVL